MSVDETKRAAQITKAYAEDREGLTRKECKGAGFSDAQCNVLVPALGKGAEGNITADEQKKLEEFGFAKEFIQSLAGDDGNKALRNRVRWLADHITPKNYRICTRDCDVRKRTDNILELESIGPDAAEAVPSLIKAIQEKYWLAHVGAIVALGHIGPAAREAIPALIAIMRDRNQNFGPSEEAAESLGHIGPAAMPALVKIFQDKEENFFARSKAAMALGYIPPAIPILIQVLEDKNDDMHAIAALALGNISSADENVIQALIAALKDEDWRVRINAAEALGKIGPAAKQAIPALVALLKNWDREKNNQSYSYLLSVAEDSLASIGPPAIPALIEALKFDSPYNGINLLPQASRVLIKIGLPAVPALIKALKDEDLTTRREAASTLGAIGDPHATPALIAALKDEDSDVRCFAAVALGQIGDHLAIPPLQKMIREDPDLFCRQRAQEAFDKIMEKFR